jgi:predicted DNA-binding protein
MTPNTFGFDHAELAIVETKQTTMRLEKELSKRLSQVCRQYRLSREVLIEALFEHYEQDQERWALVLNSAQEKADLRMQSANYKRAQSMMNKFTQ